MTVFVLEQLLKMATERTRGFSAYYIRHQDSGLSVVSLCNNADLWPGEMSRKVFKLYLGE